MRPILGLGLAAVLVGGVPAKAVPITGGVTEIEFSDAIADLVLNTLGASISGYGGATLDLFDFVAGFPVTGGTSASGGLPGSIVEHVGSGLVLTRGTTSFEFGEFVVDTNSGVVTSSAISTNPAEGDPLDIPGGSPAFTFDPNATPDDDGDVRPFEFFLTAESAVHFNDTFGLDAFQEGLGGVTGNVSIEVVPVPAGLPLLATGLAALGFVVRRRRAKAA